MIYKVNNKEPKFGKNNYIAPNVSLIGDITTGDNVSFWFNCVVRGDSNSIFFDDDTNVQDNVTVHVDNENPTKIGKRVTIGHNCVIHGCTIGDNSLIGMGTVILSGSVIPENSLVAAGSLVNHKLNAPPGALIAGSPAKVIKMLDEHYIQLLKDSNKEYLERIVSYNNSFDVIK